MSNDASGIAASLGIPTLFYSDDTGCYCTRTRDAQPGLMQELAGGGRMVSDETDGDRAPRAPVGGVAATKRQG